MPEPKPDFPMVGDIVWLSPEQGGRASGPPATPWETYYFATALVVPPTGPLASICLDVSLRDAWTSPAVARWLVAPGPAVDEGSVLAVTEGARTVAIFTVTGVVPEGGEIDRRRQPLSGQGIAEIEARARVATRGPWRSFVEGRDHLSGDSFVMTGPEDDRGPDLYLTWDPPVPEEQRLADQDFIAHTRQDVLAMAAELRELRLWHGLVDDDECDRDAEGDHGAASQPSSVVNVVQTDPSLPESRQIGAFTTMREAVKALHQAQIDWPSETLVINSFRVWERFSDYRSRD